MTATVTAVRPDATSDATHLVKIARMEDAAFAVNLSGTYDVGAGYYGGPNAYHIWGGADFKLAALHATTHRVLPIWVAGQNGADEGATAVQFLKDLGVPYGAYTAVDMEGRKDRTYTERFYTVLRGAGYRVWVYGSRDFVFANPQCNGYWVAEYGITTQQAMNILESPGVRAVQYEPNIPPGHDDSLLREWTEASMWRPA